MSRQHNPCKGVCPERSSTCHGSCTRGYTEYAEQCRAEREARKKNSVWTASRDTIREHIIAHNKKMEMGYFK